MASSTWWPRLLAAHRGELAWDDDDKDYSDLPQHLQPPHNDDDHGGAGSDVDADDNTTTMEEAGAMANIAVPSASPPTSLPTLRPGVQVSAAHAPAPHQDNGSGAACSEATRLSIAARMDAQAWQPGSSAAAHAAAAGKAARSQAAGPTPVGRQQQLTQLVPSPCVEAPTGRLLDLPE